MMDCYRDIYITDIVLESPGVIRYLKQKGAWKPMPVYEYKCVSCKMIYDIFHKGKELTEDIVCPRCSSSDYKKLMSAASVSSKGTAGDTASCSTGNCCGGNCNLDE